MYYLHNSVYFFTFVNNSKKNIDRGKLLKNIVEKSGISISNLVKKVGYKDRASYYTHIDKPDLSLDILFAYAKVLNYDLRQDLSDINPYMLEDPASLYYTTPETFDEAIVLLGKWKERYSQLLEKYIRVMEDKNIKENK